MKIDALCIAPNKFSERMDAIWERGVKSGEVLKKVIDKTNSERNS